MTRKKADKLPKFLEELKKAVCNTVDGVVIGEAYSKGQAKNKRRIIFEVDYTIVFSIDNFNKIGGIDKAVQKWADDQGGTISMLEEKREEKSSVYGTRYAVSYFFFIAVTEKFYDVLPREVAGLDRFLEPKELFTVGEIMEEYIESTDTEKLYKLQRRFEVMNIDKKTVKAILEILQLVPGAYEEYENLSESEKQIAKEKLLRAFKNFSNKIAAVDTAKSQKQEEKPIDQSNLYFNTAKRILNGLRKKFNTK